MTEQPRRCKTHRAVAWSVGAWLLLMLPLGRAHPENPHQLAGTVLCLDPSSVLVDTVAPVRLEPQSVLTEIGLSLQRLEVKHLQRASCRGRSGFLLATVKLSPDPEHAEAVAFTISLQVGGYLDPSERGSEPELPASGYGFFVAAVHSPAWVEAPLEPFLQELFRLMTVDLAVSWWEDNPPAPASPYRLPLLGATLAAVAALGAYGALRYVKRRG